MYCSPRYQRRNGAWSVSRKCRFIENIFKSRIPHSIVVAEISNRDRSLDGQPLTVQHACIDGQHRSNAILEFVSNQFGFTGIIAGNRYNNHKFSKLPLSVQSEFILNCEVPVYLTPETEDLPRFFIDINSGAPTNRQEERNAIPSHISGWVREHSESFKEVFSQVSGAKYDRMDDCVLIARIALMLTGYHGNQSMATTNIALDDYYKLSDESKYDSTVLNYISTELLPALKFIAASHKKNRNSKIKTRDLFGFVLIHNALSNYKPGHFINPDALYSWCKETIEDLDIQYTRKYIKDERKYGRNNISKINYFHYLTRNIQRHESVKTFREHIFSSFKENLDMLIDRLEEKDFHASEEELTFDDVSILEEIE